MNFALRLFVILTFLLTPFTAFIANANAIVAGVAVKVIDGDTKEVLIGANIRSTDKSNERGFVTDIDGIAKINGYDLDEIIRITYTGYGPKEISFGDLIRSTSNSVKVVEMKAMIFDIDETEIFGVSKAVERREDVAHQVEVLDAREIELLNAQNTADVLQNGGVFVQKSQMGGGSPVIRGFEANKVLIVVDGVRLNNAIYRNGHLQNVISIDNAILDRTEIVQGPASVIYGSDALGGVMHFFTKDPKLNFSQTNDNVVEGSAYVRYASANGEKAFHADVNYGTSNFASLTSFTYSDFGNLKMGKNFHPDYENFGLRTHYQTRLNGKDTVLANPNPYVQMGTEYGQVDFLQKFKFQLDQRNSIVLNFQYSTTSDIPRYDQLSNEFDLEDIDGELVPDFRWAEWNYGPQNRLFASARLRLTDSESPLFSEGSIIFAYQKVNEDRITRRFDFDWRGYQEEQVHVGTINADFVKMLNQERNQKLLYGLEFNYNFVNSNAYFENIVTREIDSRGSTRYPNGGSDMRTMAAYLNYRQKFGKDISFIAGARYTDINLSSLFVPTDLIQLPFDTIGISSRSLTGSMSLAWNVFGDWYLDAVVATAFRAPNVDDFGKIRAKNGFITVPNADLKSENSYNAELSFAGKVSNSLRMSATYYYTYLFDAIVRDNYTLNGQDSLFVDGSMHRIQANVNAGKAFLTGFSANFEWLPMEQLQVRTNINIIKGYNITAEEPLAHIPPLYGQTSITYQNERFELRGVARYNGWKRIEDYAPDSSDNAEYATPEGTPKWGVINLYGAYHFGQSKDMSVNLGVENILDQNYRPFSSGVSGPGRNLILTLRARF